MRFSICIDALYHQSEPTAALEALNALGLTAYEFWQWWTKDLAALRATQDRLGMTPVACCTRFISLVDPAQRAAYLDGVRQSIAAAQQLGCTTLISQVGDATAAPRPEQHASLVAGLKAAVPLLEAADMQLVFEPLNTKVDHPGYYLTHAAEGFEIAAEVDSPHVKLLFDIYHQQITEGDLIRKIRDNIDLIGHFHAAGNPGRHELDIGELNYGEIFRAIEATGYAGYVGLEYFPLEAPRVGLERLVK